MNAGDTHRIRLIGLRKIIDIASDTTLETALYLEVQVGVQSGTVWIPMALALPVP